MYEQHKQVHDPGIQPFTGSSEDKQFNSTYYIKLAICA
jgi:hypothetical protein